MKFCELCNLVIVDNHQVVLPCGHYLNASLLCLDCIAFQSKCQICFQNIGSFLETLKKNQSLSYLSKQIENLTNFMDECKSKSAVMEPIFQPNPDPIPNPNFFFDSVPYLFRQFCGICDTDMGIQQIILPCGHSIHDLPMCLHIVTLQSKCPICFSNIEFFLESYFRTESLNQINIDIDNLKKFMNECESNSSLLESNSSSTQPSQPSEKHQQICNLCNALTEENQIALPCGHIVDDFPMCLDCVIRQRNCPICFADIEPSFKSFLRCQWFTQINANIENLTHFMDECESISAMSTSTRTTSQQQSTEKSTKNRKKRRYSSKKIE